MPFSIMAPKEEAPLSPRRSHRWFDFIAHQQKKDDPEPTYFAVDDTKEENTKQILDQFLTKTPGFRRLMRIGALIPQHHGCCDCWQWVMPMIFAFCICVCTWRLFIHGPAYYNSFTNGAMLLLHFWLPFSWWKCRAILRRDHGMRVWNELSDDGPVGSMVVDSVNRLTIFAVG